MKKHFHIDLQRFAEGDPAGAGSSGAGNGNGELMIPKYRFDEVTQRAQAAEAKVAELQKQVDGIKAKDDKISELEKKLKETTESYEAEKVAAKRQNAIEQAIKDKVVDAEVVMKLLDNDKISLDEKGELKGLTEQLDALQKTKPYLWKPATQPVKPGANGGNGTGEKSFAQKLAEEKQAAAATAKKQDIYF